MIAQYRVYVLFSIAFLSISCQPRSKDTNRKDIKNYYFDSKDPSESYTLVNDTLDGLYLNYYRSGITSSIKSYQKGKLNGASRQYYRNGQLKSVVRYKNDTLNGIQIVYRASGMVFSVGNLSADKRVASYYEYYANGNVESYSFFDSKGRLRYRSHYDIDGALLKEEGEVLDLYNYIPDKDVYNKDDSLIVEVMTSVPPHLRRRVIKYRSNERNERFDPDTLKINKFYPTRFVIKLNETGTHSWLISNYYYDYNNLKEFEEWTVSSTEVK